MEKEFTKNNLLKSKIKKYFEETKERIDNKTHQVSLLIQSIKDENTQLLTKSK